MGRKTTVWIFQATNSKISHEKKWSWLRKENHKGETESHLIAAQNNAIRTNLIRVSIDKIQQNNKCELCGDRDETINHIIRGCTKLVQEYKTMLHSQIFGCVKCT